MIDNGAHIVLISPEMVKTLRLEHKRLRKPQLINVALNDKKKEKNFQPAMLSEYVTLTLSTLDNSWTSKKINAVIAPGLCTNILLGLPFLVHNRIVVDHELPSAIVKDSDIDLLNFFPAPKSVHKVKKSLKRKRLEIKMFHRELLKELKWKCSVLKAKIDKLSGKDTADSHFKPVNFVAAIKGRLETLELQQKYDALEENLKTEYTRIFEPILHVDELPDDVYCRIKLQDATKTISKRTYGCPRKYREAWKQYFSLPHLFLPDSRTPVGFLLDSYWTPGLQLDSYWIPTGLLDSSWIPTGFLLDFQSNRSPVGIPESSRSPTGVLLDFNHFSGKNLIATELQYKTVIVN
jgi:hypothetical protein